MRIKRSFISKRSKIILGFHQKWLNMYALIEIRFGGGVVRSRQHERPEGEGEKVEGVGHQLGVT